MTTASPTYGIKTIEIENFRGIESLRLDFQGPDGGPSEVAVLGGPNGCGKTSVLEACLLAVGHEGGYQGATGQDATRAGADHWRIRAKMHAGGGQFTAERCPNNSWRWFGDEPSTIPCLYFSSWRAPRLGGPLPITLGGTNGRPSKDAEADRVRRTKQQLIDSKAHALMSVGEWQDGEWRPAAGDTHAESLRRMNEAWELFHRGAGQRFVVGPVGADARAGFDVFLAGPGPQRIPVDALSAGQLELFAMFGSLLLSGFEEGILVIDEPELHLDPQWHALLLHALRLLLPRVQIIAATHSPGLYDSVMSFQRHFLVPDDDPRAKAWLPQGAATA